MALEKYRTYRGDIKALVAVGGAVVFVTVHTEGQPTGVHRLDADQLDVSTDALPCGGLALAVVGESIWVGGTDRRLYQCASGTAPKAIGPLFDATLTAVVPVANDRLAVLTGNVIPIVSRKDGKIQQTLELPEAGTCLTVDKTGRWLVAGTEKGTVAVFEAEATDEFVPSETDRLHEGAVTALLFENDDLRFFSAGADQKLLTTHARGRLEPEDKGRGNNHDDLVTALVWAPGDRFLSGSRDASVKTWPRTGGVKPATLQDGVGKVVGLAVVKVHTKERLAVACDDNSIRLFDLEQDGRFGEEFGRVYGAADWAKTGLRQTDPKRREKVLRTLAKWKDAEAIDRVAKQLTRDSDHGNRLLAAQILSDSGHPRAVPHLEKALNHDDEAVRLEALRGLRQHLGNADVKPLDLALKTGKPDVGKLAVKGLEELASSDDQALARLVECLKAGTWDVRRAALESLEAVHAKDAAAASLQALGSQHGDLRRLALVRCFERGLLDDTRVQAALRRRGEDADAGVRQTAFLLSVVSRPKLVTYLRSRDPELHRQLNELERKETPVAEVGFADKNELTPEDYDPLLQATASRALDTCFRGAYALALLGDHRAFGLLLQLSREENVGARVEVCRALAALDDERAVNRLRSLLFDEQRSVRDAAYSALAQLHKDTPFAAAEAGLAAAAEDVRHRGLQTVVDAIRQKPPQTPQAPGWDLLARALNDSFPSVRGEAFKAALNLQIGGGGVDTLRFVLGSIHADVRREVLTEVMAQIAEPWAWPLLVEFLNDADPPVRADAFAFATKRSKDLPPLHAALGSRYPDVRRLAVEALVKRHAPDAQALLVAALADREKDVRLRALAALIDDEAQKALTDALTSTLDDVRVRAARALARHGDPRAREPLLALAQAAEPEDKQRVTAWQETVIEALGGLGELADPAALRPVAPLLDSPHPAIRKAAAQALVWVARPEDPSVLRQALQHADKEVRYRAVLGLAYLGDGSVAPLVFSPEAAAVLTVDEQLAAAVALGSSGLDQLAVFLDHPDENLRNRALLIHMLLELTERGSTLSSQPVHCLTGLSSKMPRVRLTSARAVEAFADFPTFVKFVNDLFNDRGEEAPWKVLGLFVGMVAYCLAYCSAQLKARTALLLKHLEAKEQAAWDLAWRVYYARHTAELREVLQARTAKATGEQVVTVTFGAEIMEDVRRLQLPLPDELKVPPVGGLTVPAEQLRELAFGAYVGLVREQGGAAATPQVVRVRQTALSRIFALASADEPYRRAARPVLVQALGDPNQAVRLQAFEHLQALGMDKAALGAEALEAGHTDLGVKGLELLTDGTSSKAGQDVLERVMLSRTDDLAVEAAKLLAAQRGLVAVASRALEASHEPLRLQGVAWLAAEYDKNSTAQELLRQALGSRYLRVREAAARELSTKKDPAAFDALVRLLHAATEPARQQGAITALKTLGDPRAAGALLDRIENDPTGTAKFEELLEAAAAFRRPETAERLLALLDRKKDWRDPAFRALLTVSGFDQDIPDPDEELSDRRWLDKQHPRHDAVLARLMERLFALGDTGLLSATIAGARWARGKDVEPILSLLASHPDEDIRRSAVEALGWRLRKRAGAVEPLLKALRHKGAETQFLAAEGLAKGQRPEGLGVLLSSVEYLDDVELRERAVLALGELGDARAIDLLLRLAGEDGHALQEAAAEAIGHLGRSPQAEQIFKLLERLAKGPGGVAERALKGLRWLNTHAGWQLIRKRATDPQMRSREVPAELLGHNDEPATRDLLLKLMRTEGDSDVLTAAFRSARRLWGAESLEPLYAVVQNADFGNVARYQDELEQVLKTLCERGDPLRILEVLPQCAPDTQEPLAASLLNRPDPPLAEAQAALASANGGTVRLAARLLGRAAAATAAGKQAIDSALQKWWATWKEWREVLDRNPAAAELLAWAAECLRSLIWAAGRLGAAEERLTELLTARSTDARARPIRLEVINALAVRKPSTNAAQALEAAARGDDAEVRTLAAAVLASHEPKRAQALVEPLLSDRVSFNRIASEEGLNAEGLIKAAAAQVHYQPVVLPQLIAAKDIETLAAVARNRKLPEATRLGALESLGVLAAAAAEEVLGELGKAASEDEELRKAAWRALRRSKRARQQTIVPG